MGTKEILLIVVAFLGWSWAIIQFFINRRNHKRDKTIERRYESYSDYMKKSDELMNKVRIDPKMVYGIPSDFMATMLNGNPEEIDNALIKFNSELLEFTKKATEPIMILNQELSALLLVCSDELSPKINELKSLSIDFNNEFQNVLNSISPNESNDMIEKLKTIGHNNRWRRFEGLNVEILLLMRKEINY
jgi:hypothetical protein